MAWRPNNQLLEGELDNTKKGTITGWMRFVGMSRKVAFVWKGDCQGALFGKRIRFEGKEKNEGRGGPDYFKCFSTNQSGQAGTISSNAYFYLEWYSDANGRCVLELDHDQVAVLD